MEREYCMTLHCIKPLGFIEREYVCTASARARMPLHPWALVPTRGPKP